MGLLLRARRSPGNRRSRGSGRVIPQSPKEALLAELIGPVAAQPYGVASAAATTAAAVSSAAPPAAAASLPPAAAAAVEGSPNKGRRRRFACSR